MTVNLNDTLLELLSTQLHLQREHMDVNPLTLDEAGRVAYIRDMVLACTDELHEALNEVTWKPWTTGGPRVHDEHLFAELIDVLHLVFNLLLVARQVDPVQLTHDVREAYLAKHDVNVRRRVDGYDGVSTKCPGCGRALDEQLSLTVTRSATRELLGVWCRVCSHPIEVDAVRSFIDRSDRVES